MQRLFNLSPVNLIALCFLFSDDEPDDEGSPQHYVLIHGILTAPVIYHLHETGVNVDAIISLNSQNYSSLAPTPVQQDENKDGSDETAKVSFTQLVAM